MQNKKSIALSSIVQLIDQSINTFVY